MVGRWAGRGGQITKINKWNIPHCPIVSYCLFVLPQDQWETEHNKKQSVLEKKYQENLAEVGLGHRTASEVTAS